MLQGATDRDGWRRRNPKTCLWAVQLQVVVWMVLEEPNIVAAHDRVRGREICHLWSSKEKEKWLTTGVRVPQY